MSITLDNDAIRELLRGQPSDELLGAMRKALDNGAVAAYRKAANGGPKLGSKGHERCKYHERASFTHLVTRVLCSDVPKPGERELVAKRRFAAEIDALLAKRHAAWLARPAGDGKIVMGDGKRLAPRAFAKWQDSDAGRKAQGRYAGSNTCITVAEKPRPKRERVAYPTSKLVSSRPRRRKSVIRLSVYRGKAA